MSAALLVCASIALLLLALLGLALFGLSRVERSAGDGLEAAASSVPRRFGESSDVQVVLAFADPAFVSAWCARVGVDVPPSAVPALVDEAKAALPRAVEGTAAHGQFRAIAMQYGEGLLAVSLHVRVRRPLPVTEPRTREELAHVLDAIAARSPDAIIAARFTVTAHTTDRAAPALVRLDPERPGQ